jgi:hypothetical protein
MNTQPGSPVHTTADQAEWQVSSHYPEALRRTCRWKSLVGNGRCQGSCRINGFVYAAFVMVMFGSFFDFSVVSI